MSSTKSSAKEEEDVIYATFQPQQWIYDNAVDCAPAQKVDVTDSILSLALDEIKGLRDNRENTDWLVDPKRLGHDGPYYVSVVDSIEWFFDCRITDLTMEQLDEARERRAQRACKRCGKAGDVKGDVCGNCADDLRDTANAGEL
jgi:hypothetical protein